MNEAPNFPKKYMASGALIRNKAGEMLIVHPTYKDRWEIPGGIVEQNESPKAACERELLEELGLDIEVGRLLIVDYSINIYDQENLQFIFDGGVLTNEQIEVIRLPDDELKQYEFIQPNTDFLAKRDRLGPRVTEALKALESNMSAYLEFGTNVDEAPGAVS